ELLGQAKGRLRRDPVLFHPPLLDAEGDDQGDDDDQEHQRAEPDASHRLTPLAPSSARDPASLPGAGPGGAGAAWTRRPARRSIWPSPVYDPARRAHRGREAAGGTGRPAPGMRFTPMDSMKTTTARSRWAARLGTALLGLPALALLGSATDAHAGI